MNNKKLSNLMLLANFLSTLFYSASYPYIYAETVKVVPKRFIGLESILYCLGAIIFCRLWNLYSDKLFSHYRAILLTEVIADSILFADVLIRCDLKFYFLFNLIIFSIVTKNINCACVKMTAKVHPNEKMREQYDNNSSIVTSTATLIGATVAMIYVFNLTTLFILALIGNIVDNFFYLYIYGSLTKQKS